jgi:hypothetical protein
VKFNFVEKGGSTRKSGVQTSSACEKHRYFFALTVIVKSNSCLDELFSYTLCLYIMMMSCLTFLQKQIKIFSHDKRGWLQSWLENAPSPYVYFYTKKDISKILPCLLQSLVYWLKLSENVQKCKLSYFKQKMFCYVCLYLEYIWSTLSDQCKKNCSLSTCSLL